MPTVKFLISGLVQGVGFRAAVSRCANSLGLSGYVRNNSDGSVTAVACGPEEKVAMFELMVRTGCGSLARVEQVEKTTLEEAPHGAVFQVR